MHSAQVFSFRRSGSANTLRRARSVPCRAAFDADKAAARLQRVLKRIDHRNAKDPRQVDVDGRQTPYELAYSGWVTGWVERLSDEPSEMARIAARGQHIERWESPRDSYPPGKQAYLQWREDLKQSHSEKVGVIMAEEGYGPAMVVKVQQIMLKKNLKDPDTQLVEDALCLVFLERQFAEFRLTTDEEKMVGIIQKTWRKMGEAGREAALKLPLGEEELRLVNKALAA